MSAYEPPAELRNAPPPPGRKRTDAERAFLNIMKLGPGTPWEDRGKLGVAGAFFKTAKQSLLAPGKLADDIRRPESARDASAFAVGCGICWAAAVLIHNVIAYVRYSRNPAVYDLSGGTFWLAAMVQGALAAGGAWALPVAMARVMSGVVAGELKTAPPPPLARSMTCYAMGPAVLAPLAALVLSPLGGVGTSSQIWPLAIWPIPWWPLPVMILVILVLAGMNRRRLGLTRGSALIASIVAGVAAIGIVLAAYLALAVVWDLVTSGGSVTTVEAKKTPGAG